MYRLPRSRAQLEYALWTGDAGAELRTVATRNRHVESEDLPRLPEVSRVGAQDFESNQVAARRSIRGGMGRIGTPLDEDRQRALVVIRQTEQLPAQSAPVGS